MRRLRFLLLIVSITFLGIGCSSIRTNTQFYEPILDDLKKGNFEQAAVDVADAEVEGEYADKDRVLLHLDKGIINYYNGNYRLAIDELSAAENAIDELYTKSISKAAASILLNDNALDYSGNVYEDLYINVFKALCFVRINDYDGAYVEIRKITDKLKEFDVYFEEYVQSLNSSEETKFDIDAKKLDYYNNALSNYLAHLIFRADGDYDGSRISLEQLYDAWETYDDVYDYSKPAAVTNTTSERGAFLNVIAFAGPAPIKKPVGARITTFNDFVIVSDPTEYYAQPILIPGIKSGWNFKFEFPEITEEGTEVYDIEVWVDSTHVGNLELLENMCNVAKKTFASEKNIIFFKTVMRAVAKGIASSALGRTVKKEAGGGFLGDLAALATNIAADLTENADLRSWRTMPGYSFVGEFDIQPGTYNVEIRFVNMQGKTLAKREYKNYKVTSKLNLLDAVYLN